MLLLPVQYVSAEIIQLQKIKRKIKIDCNLKNIASGVRNMQYIKRQGRVDLNLIVVGL